MPNGVRPTRRALGVLKKAGHKVRQSKGGLGRPVRYTVVGRSTPKPRVHRWYNPFNH